MYLRIGLKVSLLSYLRSEIIHTAQIVVESLCAPQPYSQIIVLRRMNAGLEQLLWKIQCGFRKNRSFIDQIYSLRTLLFITA